MLKLRRKYPNKPESRIDLEFTCCELNMRNLKLLAAIFILAPYVATAEVELTDCQQPSCSDPQAVVVGFADGAANAECQCVVPDPALAPENQSSSSSSGGGGGPGEG